jgi:hypothetical protein
MLDPISGIHPAERAVPQRTRRHRLPPKTASPSSGRRSARAGASGHSASARRGFSEEGREHPRDRPRSVRGERKRRAEVASTPPAPGSAAAGPGPGGRTAAEEHRASAAAARSTPAIHPTRAGCCPQVAPRAGRGSRPSRPYPPTCGVPSAVGSARAGPPLRQTAAWRKRGRTGRTQTPTPLARSGCEMLWSPCPNGSTTDPRRVGTRQPTIPRAGRPDNRVSSSSRSL